MDRSSMRDDYYEIAEKRRRILAEGIAADPRTRALAQSGPRNSIPRRAPASASSLGLVLVTVLGALALVACVASAALVVVGGSWLQGALNSPASTTQDFYSALQQSNYATAYTYFSSSARAHLSESAFTDQFSGYQMIEGQVAHVSLGAPLYKSNGNVAIVSVSVARGLSSGRVQVNQVMLVKEQGSWRINSISIKSTTGAPATP